MREIKFRGKRVDNGEFAFGDLLYDEEQNKAFIAEYFEDKSAYFREVIPETVGQYTGRKDINGKELYEGDVVKCTSRILTNFGKTDTGKVDICYRQVIWKDDSWGYRVVKKGEVGYGVGFESKGIKILSEFGEVVGNCYENPELLQG